MTKRKKAGELTTEGLAKRLFPKQVREEAKRQVSEKKEKKVKKSATEKQGS